MDDAARLLLIWLGAVSLLTFILFGWDKLMARLRRRRIPECALLAAALCGGGAGGTLGMALFRHKIRKRAFRRIVPAALVLQVALLVWAQFYK
ncbi:MAG TPA: DUF1294 domain-containing protein [Candidatus Enterenecus stercoripullorum]|nr:DUF1294 domain-containing protein [Candidatus Enterenecus stercoripullorum]